MNTTPRCSVCWQPAHVSETNAAEWCAECAELTLDAAFLKSRDECPLCIHGMDPAELGLERRAVDVDTSEPTCRTAECPCCGANLVDYTPHMRGRTPIVVERECWERS